MAEGSRGWPPFHLMTSGCRQVSIPAQGPSSLPGSAPDHPSRGQYAPAAHLHALLGNCSAKEWNVLAPPI